MEIGIVLDAINNHFENMFEHGVYEFKDGSVKVRGNYFQNGYVRILGTGRNDGVYKVENFADGILSIAELKEEKAECYIVRLAIPSAFLNLFKQIQNWQDSQAKGIASESIQGYYSVSYRSSDGFLTEFKSQLAPYRKIGFDKLSFTRYTKEF